MSVRNATCLILIKSIDELVFKFSLDENDNLLVSELDYDTREYSKPRLFDYKNSIDLYTGEIKEVNTEEYRRYNEYNFIKTMVLVLINNETKEVERYFVDKFIRELVGDGLDRRSLKISKEDNETIDFTYRLDSVSNVNFKVFCSVSEDLKLPTSIVEKIENGSYSIASYNSSTDYIPISIYR